MNGFWNMNFMMTFLLAKDLPETRDKLLMAMSAGQSANLLAPVLLKLGPIDTITDLEQKNADLAQQISDLQAALDECRKTVPKVKEINAVFRKIRSKKTVQELKDDEALLTELYGFAGQLG